jgi:hypothetical protein
VGSALTPGVIAMLSVVGLVGLLGGVAQLVGFFASMTYMMRLARRLPDAAMERQAYLYRWLLPVVYVAGLIVCGLGPLAAFVMYIIQIDTWRRRLRDLGRSVMIEDLRGAGRVG